MWIADLHVGLIKFVILKLGVRIGRLQLIDAEQRQSPAHEDAALFLAGLKHQDQHLLEPAHGDLPIGVNVIDGWGLRETCEESGLSQRELIRRCPEVRLGRGLHPIGQITKVDFIQVQLEDLFFCVAARDFGCQKRFADLAHVTVICCVPPGRKAGRSPAAV